MGALRSGTAQSDAAAFLAAMPDAYREAFGDVAGEHAAIAERRGDRNAHLERWRTLEDGTSVLCVVADDRAGLLSTICRVFVAHELDIVSAEVHCRKRVGLTPEAFDVFWLRHRQGAEEPLADELLETLASDVDAAVTHRSNSTLPPGVDGHARDYGSAPPPRVYFNSNSLRYGEYVLIVEALDCPGLLLAITLALHQAAIEITSSSVLTEGRIARDSFVLAGPGAQPLSSARLAGIRQAVIEAVRKRLVETEATR